MRRLAILAALLIAMPAVAQPRRHVSPPPPEESVWGKGSEDFRAAFNRDMARRGQSPRLDAMLCDVTSTLDCSAELRGGALRLTGQASPEAVRGIRLTFTRATGMPNVAAAMHGLVAILEPREDAEARRQAVLRLMGVGRPAQNQVTIGRTEIRFVDGFRDMAFQLSQVPG